MSPAGRLVAAAVLLSLPRGDGSRQRRPPHFSGSVQENRAAGTRVSGLSVPLNRLSPEPWCPLVAGRKWRLHVLGEGGAHFDPYFQPRFGQVTLRTSRPLDRELRAIYSLRLTLCCQLCRATEQPTVLAALTVTVLDLNDNAPRFLLPPGQPPPISLEVTARLRSEVYRVRAEDPDQGTNADLVYFAQPGSQYFFVIPKTGQVMLVESILELRRTVTLTLYARDRGQPPLLSAPLRLEICPQVRDFPSVTRLRRSLPAQPVTKEVSTTTTKEVLPEDPTKSSLLYTGINRSLPGDPTKSSLLYTGINRSLPGDPTKSSLLYTGINRSLPGDPTKSSLLYTGINRSLPGDPTKSSLLYTRINRSLPGDPTKSSLLHTRINRSLPGETTKNSLLYTRINRSLAGETTKNSLLYTRINRSLAGETTKNSLLYTGINRSLAGETTKSSLLYTRINRSLPGDPTKSSLLYTRINRSRTGDPTKSSLLYTRINRSLPGDPTKSSLLYTRINRSLPGDPTKSSLLYTRINRSLPGDPTKSSLLYTRINRSLAGETTKRHNLKRELLPKIKASLYNLSTHNSFLEENSTRINKSLTTHSSFLEEELVPKINRLLPKTTTQSLFMEDNTSPRINKFLQTSTIHGSLTEEVMITSSINTSLQTITTHSSPIEDVFTSSINNLLPIKNTTHTSSIEGTVAPSMNKLLPKNASIKAEINQRNTKSLQTVTTHGTFMDLEIAPNVDKLLPKNETRASSMKEQIAPSIKTLLPKNTTHGYLMEGQIPQSINKSRQTITTAGSSFKGEISIRINTSFPQDSISDFFPEVEISLRNTDELSPSPRSESTFKNTTHEFLLKESMSPKIIKLNHTTLVKGDTYINNSVLQNAILSQATENGSLAIAHMDVVSGDLLENASGDPIEEVSWQRKTFGDLEQETIHNFLIEKELFWPTSDPPDSGHERDSTVFQLRASTGEKTSLESAEHSSAIPEDTTIGTHPLELLLKSRDLAGEGSLEPGRIKRSSASLDSFLEVSLPEDTPVGSVVTTLVSREPWSPWFELVPPSSGETPVAVNGESGEVTLISTLDRESQETYQLLIREQDRAGEGWHLLYLQLTVTDVNDESPKWMMEPFPYLAAVSPLAASGTYVYKLNAIDRDKGDNGEVEYFLLEGGGHRFVVDRSSGWIQTTGLSLEEDAEYQLLVQASDKLGNKSSPATVSVVVGARPPQFKNVSYTVYISENTPAGRILVTASAVSHQNRTLSYSLISNPHKLFTVHRLTGAISMTKSLDYERDPHQFLLVVMAKEDQQSLSSTAEVVVVITDINDCAPEFQQTIYSKEGVPENTPQTTTLLQVLATDCDTGINGEFSYFTLSPDFSISKHGVITPAMGLDYERSGHMYEFVILAIDRGEVPNTGTATVRIRVSNVNDEAPEFSQTIYRTFVSEDAAPNTLVATVQAFDPDGDRVTYTISEGNKEGNFVIDPQKGIIRLGSSLLPQLHRTEYVLSVVATDDNSSGGPHSLSSTATVVVRVDDINNNKPIFHKCLEYTQNASVLENQPPGTFVLHVEAKDADSGVNGQVKYSIVHREGYLPAFTIHPDTGVITTLQTFDREKEKEYPLTIKATDQGSDPLIGLCQINVAILDQNDNDPSFENNRYEYFLKEDTPIGTSFLRLTAHDEDYGLNAALTYSVAGEKLPVFQINSTTGWLYVYQPISRKSLITQEVIATDGGNRSTRVEVAVRVTDAQNQPPVWQKDKYEIIIPENTLRDTPVVTVKARSLLGDPRVTYNLEEGLVPESNMPVRFYLTVNREDGSASVLVAENLDYEATKNFILKIRAQNVAAVPLAAFTIVYINITDVNDNVPFFSSSIYEASVTEGLELGTFVLQVTASDQDLGLNGEITYSILEDSSGDHALFHIDPQTGSIYTAAVFDRETKTSYLLEVRSSDGFESARPGKHGQPNSDTAYVRIFISDVNDNLPAFARSAYYVNVDEDRDVGTVVATVSASDPDEGMNANIRYQITAGNVGGVLDVNPETGSILIVHPLDFEDVKVYVLTLGASDGKWEDYTTVTINVLNKNDEAPVFSLNEYRGSVAEGRTDVPVFVLQVSATDPDHNDHGGLKYSLHGSGAENIFTINERTGHVFALKTLDREEHSVWRFVVLATDDEGDGLTGFADVIIYVNDINDNAPQFICTFNICNASVIEHSPPNTFIMEVTAIDHDDKNQGENAILTYSMVANPLDSSNQELFTINHETGAIYTTTGNLDRERNDTYFILVKVEDGGGLSTTGTATITVIDINDHTPKFTQDVWTVVIPETSKINSKVLEVSVVDEDIGENALLTFSIIAGDPDKKFSIENSRKKQQAEIKLKKLLDYENPQERHFNLTIKVEDLHFSSISYCLIELQDFNDNPPVFTQSVVHVTPIFENITVGSIITQVIATDIDSGENGQISYIIQDDPGALEGFLVDQHGTLIVAKSLDREVVSQYAVIILAVDEGFPPQTGTATVFLTLLDVNDNGPEFDGLYTPVIWENSVWPQTIQMNESSYLLHVVDMDSPENGQPFRFSLPSDLLNSSDFLLIDHGNNTASVQTQRSFDHEQEKEFLLPVIVTDSGNPPMSATNTLTITIGDENDNGHREGHKEVYIYIHGAPRSRLEVGKVFAPDEDDWDNKTFSAISEMPAHFLLDSDTGTLIMLENARHGVYNLEVKVSDGVWPDVTSTVRIHLKEIHSDAIYYSTSLILTNITAEEFIEKNEYGVSKEDCMRSALAKAATSHPDDIQIFGLSSEGGVTELRLAIQASTSSYHKSDTLRNVIARHKDQIQAAVQTEVFLGEPEFCLHAVCLKSTQCPGRDASRDSQNVVDAGNASFVTVIHGLAAACRCPYFARARPSCSSLPQNPCLHGGTCIDTAIGYRCQCSSPLHGPLCQLTLRNFQGDGYTWFPSIRFCSENHLSLEFISDKPDGTVLYHGPVSGWYTKTFMLVDIVQGVLGLKIGQAHDSLLHLRFPESVNVTDSKWHRLDIRLKNKKVLVTLDHCSSAMIFEKEGVGKRLLSEDRTVCELQGRMEHEWRIESQSAPCGSPQSCTGDPITSYCGCLHGDQRHECERDAAEHLFQSGSFIQYRFPHPFHPQRTHFQAMIRTRQSHGTILSLFSRDRSEYIILQVFHGTFGVSYNIGDGDYMVTLAGHRLDSGEWHEVHLERIQNEFSLYMNGGGAHHGEVTVANGTYKEIRVDPSSVTLGGSNTEEASFQGCIRDVRLNGYKLPMENQSNSPVTIIKRHRVTRGCISDVCRSSPCSQGFICTDLWMIHECSCPPGYLLMENSTSQWCAYTMCVQSPCKYGTCIPRSVTEFSCLCSQGFAGSHCDVILHVLDPGFTLSTFLITCIASTALIAVIGGAMLLSRCKKKRGLNEGVYHVSAYHDEPGDTRQNIFHYNEEGGGEEDQDAFNMTDLQLSLRSSPALSLGRGAKDRHVHSPLSCDYHASDSQKAPSKLPAPRLSCSFSGGTLGQYVYDVCQDAAYVHSSCDSLKVYDTEGAGSSAGSLSTLASSGMDSDLEYEDVRAWGPKFYYLSKLYSYTEDDDAQ
ncbi:neural-cadherin-like [Gastrophryne carolinensis]